MRRDRGGLKTKLSHPLVDAFFKASSRACAVGRECDAVCCADRACECRAAVARIGEVRFTKLRTTLACRVGRQSRRGKGGKEWGSESSMAQRPPSLTTPDVDVAAAALDRLAGERRRHAQHQICDGRCRTDALLDGREETTARQTTGNGTYDNHRRRRVNVSLWRELDERGRSNGTADITDGGRGRAELHGSKARPFECSLPFCAAPSEVFNAALVPFLGQTGHRSLRNGEEKENV